MRWFMHSLVATPKPWIVNLLLIIVPSSKMRKNSVVNEFAWVWNKNVILDGWLFGVKRSKQNILCGLHNKLAFYE